MRITGDLGNDVLTGRPGADVFNFRAGQGRDIVTDFAAGDRIALSHGDAADFAALTLKMTMAGEDTVISLTGQTVVLLGVSTSALTASDFLFD
jgi:Ca2+-binding RTX toxin-like protein